MSRNNRAHHSENGRTDVLQFEKEKRKRRTSEHSKNRIIQKQNRATTCVSDEQNEKKKIKIVVIAGIIFSTIFVTALFEFVFFNYVGFINGIGSFVSLTGLVVSVSVDAEKPVFYDETDFFRRVIDGIIWLKDVWRSKPVFTFLLVTLVVINVSALMSKYAVCSRLVYAADKGMTAFLNYEEKTYKKSADNQGALGNTAFFFKTEGEEKVNNDMESLAAEDSPYIFSEEEIIGQFGKENYLAVKNIIVTKDDRNREMNLSTSDYNDIFHLEGEFRIEDWNDQETIDAIILQEVQDEIRLKKENKFDEEAPGGLRSDVNAASEKEKKEHTFSERTEIMGTRAGAYGLYPKSSLAKLVSNDNQALALSLVLIGGKKQTEMYYYGESIIWGREYLGFADVSAGSVKEKLNWIAERYKDIMSICSESDIEYMYADRLMKAYQHAANEF